MLWSGDIEASMEDVQNPLSQLLQISGHLGARAGFAPRGRRAFNDRSPDRGPDGTSR